MFKVVWSGHKYILKASVAMASLYFVSLLSNQSNSDTLKPQKVLIN